ncbi:MAG: sodium:proton antiporter [Spartobacteria bacterium]|nr:sodium:proton antiporter [Spartobacteria bacterium]
MIPDVPIQLISWMVGFLLIAALGAIFFRQIHFPYTIGLVLVGLALGSMADRFEPLAFVHHFHLTPNIILYILLPTLIYDAALNIDTRLLVKNLTPVVALAAPGLVIATLITGGLVALISPLGLGAAMVFGALISATDPVAVIALFKELGAPKRLTMLVDGESLFNDATSIVAFDIMRGLVVGGVLTGTVLFSATSQFILVFLGGFLVGALIGYAMILIFMLAKNDPLIEIAISSVIAYAAFILAQYYLNLSGVMAVVGAGLVIAWYGATHFTPAVKAYMEQFWSYASFLANSFIFLLLGLTEDFITRGIGRWTQYALIIAVAIVSILIARAVVIFGLVPLLNRLPKSEYIGKRKQAVMFWGGLRGALPIGLAISLPADFPNRAEIIQMTLGVVMFTLLLQGTTISKLMHALKLDQPNLADRLSRAQALISARKEAHRRISQLEQTRPMLPKTLIKNVGDKYLRGITEAEKALQELQAEETAVASSPEIILWLQATTVARKMYHTFFEKAFISLAVLREAEHSIDLTMSEVRKGKQPHPFHPLLPVYYKWNRVLSLQAARLFPRAAWVRAWGLAITRTEYERASALVDVCTQIQHELPRMGELCGASKDTIDACRAHFRDRRQQAIAYLEKIAKKYPNSMKLIEESAVEKIAFDTERQTVNEILGKGGISPTVAESLYTDISVQSKSMALANQRKEGEADIL